MSFGILRKKGSLRPGFGKAIAILSAVVLVLGVQNLPAEISSGDQGSTDLHIAPSSSKLAGGTASLVVGALSRSGLAYVGDYRIKVFPYIFKSETGRLVIKVPDDAFHQMLEGHATKFTGRSTSDGTGQSRKVTAQANPVANDHGDLTFTVATDHGPLVFNTSYRIGAE